MEKLDDKIITTFICAMGVGGVLSLVMAAITGRDGWFMSLGAFGALEVLGFIVGCSYMTWKD